MLWPYYDHTKAILWHGNIHHSEHVGQPVIAFQFYSDPMKVTVNNFLHMIYAYDVRVVVAVVGRPEDRFYDYAPRRTESMDPRQSVKYYPVAVEVEWPRLTEATNFLNNEHSIKGSGKIT